MAAAAASPLAAAVRPAAGQHGQGLTVFQGRTIERFDVEFLGELARWGSTGDVMLARVSGGPLAQTGVLQGMSGSPVFVDGELVGAVMATWPFAKEPLAAIRPIEEMRRLSTELQGGAHPTWRPGMLEAASPGPDPSAWAGLSAAGSRRSVADLLLPRTIAQQTRVPGWADWLRRGGEPGSGGGDDLDAWDPRPDATLDAGAPLPPLGGGGLTWLAAGFAPQVRGQIERAFGASVLISPVASPAGASSASAAPVSSEELLRPGDAMAVLLVDGDARLGAVGTVTERIGATVLGFGHPLLGAGPTSLPLAPAQVVALMPSGELSFKFATADRAVGALLFDRSAGVCGQVGVKADMLPVSVQLTSPSGREDRFHFEVARHPVLLPSLAQWSVQSGVAAGHENIGESTGQLEVRLNVAGEAPIVNRAALSGLGVAGALGEEIALPLALVAFNDERILRVDSVDVALNLRAGQRAARVGRVIAQPATVRPGQTLRVRVELLPHRAQPQWLELELPVPRSTAAGNYQLRVSDGASAFRDEISRAASRWQSPGVRQIREAFELRRPASMVVAVLYGTPQGVIVRGRELGQLPPSALGVLSRAHGTPAADAVAATPIANAEGKTEWVVDGAARIAVVVEPADH